MNQNKLTSSVRVREEPGSDLALTSEGGPVVAAEVELRPLAPRSQLLPAVVDAPTVTPAVATGGWGWLFVLTVVLPMAAAAVYLLAIATPRFSSSASFVVRSTVQQSENPIAALAANSTSTIAHDETNAVNAYLTSRDVVDQLVKNNGLRAILDRPGADFLFRYPTFWLPNNNEYLYQRFQWMADAEVDPITNISTIDVNAFTAEDARAIASAMLGYAEALVNQMNERAYKDGVANADRSVAEARRQFDTVEEALRAFRNETGSVDPNLVAGSKLKVIEGLSTELAEVEATIAQQTTIAPNAPSLKGLRAQAESYRKEIDKRKLEIAGSTGSEAAKLEGYEKLVLERELAAKALAFAEADQTQARQDAERQHLYVQLISRPNLSIDFAKYPRTTLDLLVLLAICLGIFQLLRMLGGITAEHRA